MATRKETHDQRLRIEQTLRDELAQSAMRRGAFVPSVREVAARHRVSTYIARAAMQTLTREGLLHGSQGLGTFVGGPRPKVGEDGRELFLMLVGSRHESNGRAEALRVGFEHRIAERGCAVLSLDQGQLDEMRRENLLPPVAGIFEWASVVSDEFSEAARVHFWEEGDVPRPGVAGRDSVAFDDAQGGRLATEHLLECGHRRIAFLGVERGDEIWPRWSRERERGWKATLERENIEWRGWAFHPLNAAGEPSVLLDEVLARETVCNFLPVLGREGFSAVVAANDRVAKVLLEELARTGVPRHNWPSMVGFDNEMALRGRLLSSLHLPWNELGRAAADSLWDRSHHKLPPEPQHRAVPMRLIPRLSCQKQWSLQTTASLLSFG